MRTMLRLATGLVLAVVLYLVSSIGFFYYRDNFATHYPVKVVSASAFRSGSIPYWNRYAGGGQPLAGNPNMLTFYPDNLLYLLFPPHIAFDLHFLLHLAIGTVAMQRLLVRCGTGGRSAAAGAAIYLLSGAVLTATAFYNLSTYVALIPLFFLALDGATVERGWRRILELGAAGGLIGLAGEPVVAIGTALCGLVLIVGRVDVRGLARLAAAAVIASLIALPQWIAYREIASEVERGRRHYSTETVLAASLTPERLRELILGPVEGIATELGRSGYWANHPAQKWPPLFLSLLLGAIVIPAIAAGVRTRWAAAAAVMLFAGSGSWNPLLRRLVEEFDVLRRFRYPEKLALPLTVCLCVLVALFLDRERDKPPRRVVLTSAVSLILLIFVATISVRTTVTSGARIAVIVMAIIAASVLFLAAAAPKRWSKAVLLALTFAPLVYWGARAIPIDMQSRYSGRSPLLSYPGRAVAHRPGRNALHLAPPHERTRYRLSVDRLEPLFAVPEVRFIRNPTPDGMYSFHSRVVTDRIRITGLASAVRLLRASGADRLLSARPLRDRGLTPQTLHLFGSNPMYDYSIVAAEPRPFIAEKIFQADGVDGALATIESPRFDSPRSAVVPAGSPPIAEAGAQLSSIRYSQDRVTVGVRGDRTSLLVLPETYFAAWQVTSGATSLRTLPVNADRLGVVVPAGNHTVTATFGRRRRLVAASIFLSAAFLLAGAASAMRRSSTAIAVPAR